MRRWRVLSVFVWTQCQNHHLTGCCNWGTEPETHWRLCCGHLSLLKINKYKMHKWSDFCPHFIWSTILVFNLHEPLMQSFFFFNDTNILCLLNLWSFFSLLFFFPSLFLIFLGFVILKPGPALASTTYVKLPKEKDSQFEPITARLAELITLGGVTYMVPVLLGPMR